MRRSSALILAPAGMLALALLLAVRCADNPAVAPLLGSGNAEVELRLVDGALARAASPPQRLAAASSDGLTSGGCEIPPPGFPEDTHVTLFVNPPSGVTLIRSIDIPARTERALVVEGLTPGDGYRVEVEVMVRGMRVFEGESALFIVYPGGRSLVGVDLAPPSGRRAVLAFGEPVISDAGAVVPVMASHSRPLRGIEFEFCFDPEVLEPLAARAVGSRVGDFRGAGGQPGAPGIYHAVLWSPDPDAVLAPGRDQVLEIGFRFRSVAGGGGSNLVFMNALVTDSADSLGFTTYFRDKRVDR